MLRISITAVSLLMCGIVSFCYSQDSIKKSNPEQTIKKPNTQVAKTYQPHTSKADSIVLKQLLQRTVPTKADTNTPFVITDKSLNGQYSFLLTKVYHYQQPFLSAFWKSASDTLKFYRQKQNEANSKLARQNKIIDSLKAQVTNKDEALSTKVEEITFLGIQMPLSTYNIITWGLVIAFALTALIVISNSGRSRHEAKYRTSLYNELEEEFKTFKTKANDKEKKLARELQTERNKLEELLGKDKGRR